MSMLVGQRLCLCRVLGGIEFLFSFNDITNVLLCKYRQFSWNGCNSCKEKPAIETVKQTIIDNLIDDEMEEDSKAEYKAMIELRENYGL